MSRVRSWCVVAVTASVVAVGAGCSDPAGLYIEVTASSSVTTIELFVGEKSCVDPETNAACAITTPMSLPQLKTDNGGIWNRSAVSFIATAHNGKATFRIENSGSAATLQIIAVGYAPTANPGTTAGAPGTEVAVAVLRDQTVPVGQATVIQTQLVDALPADRVEQAMSPHPDGTYLEVWGPPAPASDAVADSKCVVAEQWAQGVVARSLVVPAGNPDCDSVLTQSSAMQDNPLECDPMFYQRTKYSTHLSDSTCVAIGPITTGANACELAGPKCADGVGFNANDCTPSPFTMGASHTCVPSEACLPVTAPCMSGFPVPLDTCLKSLTALHVQCTILKDDLGMPCVGPTNPTHGSVDLTSFLQTTRMCSDGRFVTGGMSGLIPTTSFAFTGASMVIDSNFGGSGQCLVELEWNGGTNTGATETALLYMTIDNGNHVIVPVTFTLTGCPVGPSFPVDGITCVMPNGVSDTLLNCAQ